MIFKTFNRAYVARPNPRTSMIKPEKVSQEWNEFGEHLIYGICINLLLVMILRTISLSRTKLPLSGFSNRCFAVIGQCIGCKSCVQGQDECLSCPTPCNAGGSAEPQPEVRRISLVWLWITVWTWTAYADSGWKKLLKDVCFVRCYESSVWGTKRRELIMYSRL